jgi:hypothetical protein
MSKEANPWEIPEWHAIRREASLIRHLIGSGVTALGHANYADKAGEYYTAFFGLSVGLERLNKLSLVADYAISNKGQMPDQKIICRFRHKLADLTNEVEKISQKHSLKLKYARPTNEVGVKIIDCLDAFADARRGRYANFAALGDPNLGREEPIRKWWSEVAELILKKHYYGKQVQAEVEARAKIIDTLTSPFTMVLHTNETGDAMHDVLSSSVRTGQTDVVQKYGRYYTLMVVRWLAEIYSALSKTACYSHNIDAFLGTWEYFETYMVDDEFMKTRRIWPLH